MAKGCKLFIIWNILETLCNAKHSIFISYFSTNCIFDEMLPIFRTLGQNRNIQEVLKILTTKECGPESHYLLG